MQYTHCRVTGGESLEGIQMYAADAHMNTFLGECIQSLNDIAFGLIYSSE